MRFNAVDTRNCLFQLERKVHLLNTACIHNNDITKILGLDQVPGNVGRLTHFLLKRKVDDVYKYSTLLLGRNSASSRVQNIHYIDVENTAYFCRYYLNLIGLSVIEFVHENPGCTQAHISEKCLGLKKNDYNDQNWIASQLLNVLKHHGLVNKYTNHCWKKGRRTSVTLVNDNVRASCRRLTNRVFRFGYENVREYMHTKRLGTPAQQGYLYHLLNNNATWGIHRIEANKTFPGLVGQGGKPLRINVYIEQEDNVRKGFEIKKKEHNEEHAKRKLDYNDLILVNIST